MEKTKKYTKIPPEIIYESNERIKKHMRKVHRDFVKKQTASIKAAKNTIINI